MPPYGYSPLPGPDSIRLLRLLPDVLPSSQIRCQLLDFNLDISNGGNYLYDALSYVWGDPSKPYTLDLEGYNLPITANLHVALVHLRDPYFERILWVDAVCINQGSLQERAHQVRSMAKIYGKANRVIVWLGKAADGSDEAIEELRESADEELTKPPQSDSSEKAVLALLNRSWFRRIWVIHLVIRTPSNV